MLSPLRFAATVLAFTLFAGLVSGCRKAGWKLEGTVIDQASKPIAGAKVDLRCSAPTKKAAADKGAVADRGTTTDGQGKFALEAGGEGVPLGCTIEIKKGGLAGQKLQLMTSCGAKSAKDATLCASLSTTVMLKPLPPQSRGDED